MSKLTQKAVEDLAPAAEEYCVWDAQVAGLGVRVRPSGAKSFVLMYRLGGKQRKHTMGKLEANYGLKEARERAREHLQALNREYARMFGAPPRRDAIRLRAMFREDRAAAPAD